MPHADLAGCNIQDHFRNEKWIEAGSTVAPCKISHFMLKGDKSTDTACKYDTDPVRVDIFFIQSCIGHCLVAYDQCELRKAIDLSCFFFIEELCRFESFDLASEPGTKLSGVE